uniref:Acyltransferase 3 domain-containing protein n=1 Tax=Haptolina brevifila TaxID=156173 RepID=A0A7S2MU52_9EUKA
MAASLALMLAIVLAPASDFVRGDEWAPGGIANRLYLTFGRGLWGVGCAFFSVCCFAEATGSISAFLSAGLWAPLARLTYGAYLTHPIVIKVLSGAATAFYDWSYVDLTSRWLLNSLLAYALAAGAFLLVEKPFMNLEAKLFERRMPK